MVNLIENGPLKIYDGLLNEREIEHIDAWFASYLRWGLGYDMQEYGAASATLCRSLQWDMWRGYHGIVDDIHRILRYRLKKEFDVDVPYFQRCLLNNFKFGDSPMFHPDAPSNPRALTMMVFPNMTWDTNWGGETKFQDDNGNTLWCVNPIPGRVILFPGMTLHSGVSPTKVHKGYGRFSLAYQDANEDAPVFDKNLLKPSAEHDIIKASEENIYGKEYQRLRVTKEEREYVPEVS
jgi:hypothetical protein